MTVAIKCDWCGDLIEPGQHFIQETMQRMIMVSDGWEKMEDPEVNHFHCISREAGPTCYDHSRL
jgi:hypothetical protein